MLNKLSKFDRRQASPIRVLFLLLLCIMHSLSNIKASVITQNYHQIYMQFTFNWIACAQSHDAYRCMRSQNQFGRYTSGQEITKSTILFRFTRLSIGHFAWKLVNAHGTCVKCISSWVFYFFLSFLKKKHRTDDLLNMASDSKS